MAYRITNWAGLYETAETKRLRRLAWVPLPNRHDGVSYNRFIDVAGPDKAIAYAGWCLLLTLASKMPTRGVLADESGELTVRDMALATRMPEAVIEAGLRAALAVKWIESDGHPAIPSSPPAIAAESPAIPSEHTEIAGDVCFQQDTAIPSGHPAMPSGLLGRREGKGREQKGTEQNPKIDILDDFSRTSSADADGAFELQPSNGTTPAEKQKEQYSPKFLEFWSVVWQKVGKDAAWKAWKAAIKRDGKEARDRLIEAAKAQGERILADASKQSRTPIHPATWINAGRWKDEIQPIAPKSDLPDLTGKTAEEIWG